MFSHLSEVSILAVVALWLALEVSYVTGQVQYRLTPLRTGGRPMKQPQLKSGPECPTPYFRNGVAKPRQRNKMIRFTCASGFTLVGNMYSMCEKGRWDTPIPICIRSGCPDLTLVDNGQISYEYGQAAAMLFCSSGFQVAGPSKAYCNGTHWDRPLGNCRETGIGAETSCDFEAPDLCGWMNEATHDFDWKRSDGIVHPKALKTGPKFDHTTGTSLAGHFMMVDSVEQFTNETARLLSPMYPSNYSQNACFSFFYHMYGDGVGTLSVYVRPTSQQLDSFSVKDAIFSLKGNQRNVWNEGYFDLKPLSEEFQIVIEASLGLKAKSDIAIDDVSLLNGEDCRPKSDSEDDEVITPEVIPPDVSSDDNIFKLGSCENRCGVNVSSVVTIPDTSVNFVQCDCFEGCVDSKTCCPDYAERCVFNETAFSATTSTKIPTSTTETTRSTTTSTTPNITTSTSPSTTKSTTTSTKPTTTPTKPSTTSTTTQRSTTTSTEQAIPSTSTKTTAKLSPSTTTTTKIYNLRPRTTTNKPFIVPMVRTRRPTTTSTTLPPSTTTEEIVMKMFPRFGDASNDELSMLELGDSKPNLARVFLFSGIGVVSFGCVILLVVLHIRRNSGANVLNRLKQKSKKNNFGSNEGFEDVRFLAADEHLDFSLPGDETGEAGEGEGNGGNGNGDAKQKVSKKGKK
nr:MAM and LDL-receptor class A domain-containing protein 1-like [Aedes albopictus]